LGKDFICLIYQVIVAKVLQRKK